MIWILAHHLPPSPVTVSNLDRRHTGKMRKIDNVLTEEGLEGGGRGAESYDCKEPWSFINYSILFAQKGQMYRFEV
jgi:hypothetical protein